MTEWYTSRETIPKNTAPSEALARFIGRTYGEISPFQRHRIRLLDIGSGSGANCRYLIDEGYNCIGVDGSVEAYAHEHISIDEYLDAGPEPFDCIFDINTLCHMENAPYEKIYKALKPGGKFFSIHPAEGTEVDMAGKGYTRITDIMTMRELLHPLKNFSIHKCTNWSGDIKINSWQIEADK